jgi:hypothetical protein
MKKLKENELFLKKNYENWKKKPLTESLLNHFNTEFMSKNSLKLKEIDTKAKIVSINQRI